MKAHKYWSLGALACMAGCFYTGCKKLMQAHKYFACGALVCMSMAIYFGHKIAPKKKKTEKPEKQGALRARPQQNKKYHEKFKILDILAVTTQAREGIETPLCSSLNSILMGVRARPRQKNMHT